MRLTPWIDSLRTRLATPPACRRRQRIRRNPSRGVAAIEALEDRTLLAASTLWLNGLLTVTADSGEAIQITADSLLNVQVLIDGVIDDNLPAVAASTVERIEVTGGDGDNVIDLSGVRSAIFNYISLGGSEMQIDVEGGNGHDTITGSLDLDDTLAGGDGDDVINAGTGDNWLDGGDGDDLLTAGPGNDILIGEDGQDTLLAESGDDTLSGGNGHDSLMGHIGYDSIDGGHGRDSIFGGDDDDSLNGGDGRDFISGENGNDHLTGGIDSDTLLGGAGDDTLLGNTGGDRLEGGIGNDSLTGGDGRDTIYGEAGNDKLNGQRHNDILIGGNDDDTLMGGHGSDSLDGNRGDDRLKGQGGNDTLVDFSGDDYLNGGTGRDLLDSRATFLSINDVQLDVEGNAGTSILTFTVTVVGDITSPFTVDFTSSDETATAGSDYLATSGQLTFSPGDVQQTLTVTVLGDTVAENDETFLVTLSNASTVSLFDAVGQGTIVNDDPMIALGQTVNVTKALGLHAEVTMAVNPTNPDNIIVGMNSSSDMSGSPSRDPVWVTTDGGINWTKVVIPNPSGQIYSAGDPTITFDRQGRAVYAHMTWSTVDQQTSRPLLNLASAMSTDGGLNWTPGAITTGDNRDDKLWITSGPDVNNPSQDIFYVTWHRGNVIRFASSTDGINWSSMVTVNTMGASIDSIPAVGPNGEVSLCWQEFAISGDGNIYCSTSDDAGSSWSTEVLAFQGNVNAFFDPGSGNQVYLIDAQATRGVWQSISLEYDHSNGPNRGRLYMGFSDQGDLDNDPDEFNKVDHDDLDVFVIASDDNGATWNALGSGPVLVNDDGGTKSQFHPWLSVDPVTGKVGVVWHDTRNDSGTGVGDTNGIPNDDVQYYASISNDGGQSWLTNQLITAGTSNGNAAGPFNFGEYIGSDFNDNTFYMTWSDNSNSTGDNPDGALSFLDSYFTTMQITDAVGPPPPPPNTGVTITGSDTLLGGNGNDTLLAGMTDDYLRGGVGKDWIDGGEGDDTILGDGGRDTIQGGGGNDTIRGNEGNDKIDGGDGDDDLLWTMLDANDTPSGGEGRDRLLVLGGTTPDLFTITKTAGGGSRMQIKSGPYTLTLGTGIEQVELTAGDGPDVITVGNLKGVSGTMLILRGEDGNDTIDAQNSTMGAVKLLIDGGDGNDSLTGSQADDTLLGGDGNDVLIAGAGHDSVLAGDGDDSLSGGSGNDTLKGELGNDTILGNPGHDILLGDDGDDSLTGGDGDDTISGGYGDDKLNGQRDNDSLDGGFGADTLTGGSGDDLLDGGLNNDRLLGNDGNDTLRGNDGDDQLYGHAGDDLLNGGDGNDTLDAALGNDLLNGADGNDHVNAGSGADILVGGDGNDSLFGGSGADVVLGENGNDFVSGQGSSNDTLGGGEGTDSLVGLSSEIDEAFTLSSYLRALLDAV